jgi:hypothetical protein
MKRSFVRGSPSPRRMASTSRRNAGASAAVEARTTCASKIESQTVRRLATSGWDRYRVPPSIRRPYSRPSGTVSDERQAATLGKQGPQGTECLVCLPSLRVDQI